MPARLRSNTTGYVVAVGASVAAIVLRWVLDPWLGAEVPFITCFLAVVFAGWYGGLRPAVLAAILSGFCAWLLFIPPRFSLTIARTADGVGLIVYSLVTLAIAALSGAMREAQRRAETAEENALRQRETMRITFESIGDAVISTDASGHVTFLNAVAETLCGWRLADARGQPIQRVFTIIDEQTRAPVDSPIDAVLRTGQVVGLANHTVLLGRDGVGRPIDDSAAPIRDDQGDIVGAVLVFRDISTRRTAEKALRTRERELEDFFENAAMGLHWVGPDGIILRVNQTELSMLGYQRDEYVGHHIAKFHVDHDEIADILARLTRGETITNREARMRCRDGSTRTVIINSNVLWEDGRFVHTRCFTYDVTAQRKAEAQSRQLAAIVATSDDAIVSKDLNGIVQSWNRAAESVFGYSADEMIGQSITRLIPDDHADEEPQILARIRSGEKVDHFETVRQRKDGRRIPVSLTISPIVDDEGRIVGVSKIARDITQQKHSEDLLREADRRKNEFLALLAHELRNPLASIRNGLQILGITDGATPAIAMMQRQVGQMVRLIDDLLDISRISRGKIELRQQRVELASVIRDAVAAAQPVCDRMGHALTVIVPDEPVYLHADPHRLTQVIGNLLDNACKFTAHGGQVRLTIAVEGTTVVIRVRDNGIGIATDQLPRIFEMFMQADTSLERTQSGLGLGLTLAKTLVDMHGGSIECHSDGPGLGTELVVRLPLATDAAPLAPAPVEKATERAHKILVVDDNRDSADSLAMLMELNGHNVRAAYDGMEAVQLAHDFQPDVVLLDIGLPKLNGYEAARQIRNQANGARVFLIALTGWGQDEDRRRSEEAGFDAHLVKPLDYNALMQLLSNWSGPAAT